MIKWSKTYFLKQYHIYTASQINYTNYSNNFNNILLIPDPTERKQAPYFPVDNGLCNPLHPLRNSPFPRRAASGMETRTARHSLIQPPLQLELGWKPRFRRWDVHSRDCGLSQPATQEPESVTNKIRIADISDFQRQWQQLWWHYWESCVSCVCNSSHNFGCSALAACRLLLIILENVLGTLFLAVQSLGLVFSVLRDSLSLPEIFMNPFSTIIRSCFHFFQVRIETDTW